MPYVPDRAIVRRQFDRLRARGVIREAGAERYWLDTVAHGRDIERTRRVMVPIVLVLVLIGAACRSSSLAASLSRS